MADIRKTKNRTRYDIKFQTIRNRNVPYVYFEDYAFSLERFSIAQAEQQYLLLTNKIY
jgi:hypothetical protein